MLKMILQRLKINHHFHLPITMELSNLARTYAPTNVYPALNPREILTFRGNIRKSRLSVMILHLVALRALVISGLVNSGNVAIECMRH